MSTTGLWSQNPMFWLFLSLIGVGLAWACLAFFSDSQEGNSVALSHSQHYHVPVLLTEQGSRSSTRDYVTTSDDGDISHSQQEQVLSGSPVQHNVFPHTPRTFPMEYPYLYEAFGTVKDPGEAQLIIASGDHDNREDRIWVDRIGATFVHKYGSYKKICYMVEGMSAKDERVYPGFTGKTLDPFVRIDLLDNIPHPEVHKKFDELNQKIGQQPNFVSAQPLIKQYQAEIINRRNRQWVKLIRREIENGQWDFVIAKFGSAHIYPGEEGLLSGISNLSYIAYAPIYERSALKNTPLEHEQLIYYKARSKYLESKNSRDPDLFRLTLELVKINPDQRRSGYIGHLKCLEGYWREGLKYLTDHFSRQPWVYLADDILNKVQLLIQAYGKTAKLSFGQEEDLRQIYGYLQSCLKVQAPDASSIQKAAALIKQRFRFL